MERIDNGLALEDEAPAVGSRAEYDRLMAELRATEAEWFVAVAGRTFGPLDETTARQKAAETLAAGWLPTLLCREDPATNLRPVQLADGNTLAQRLKPVRTRPHSVIRGRH